MGDFLSFRLFQVGENSVTVSSLLVFLAILAITWIAARVARKIVAERLLARTNLAIGARYSVGRVLGYLIWFAGGTLALNALGINASSLAAFGAALGIGLGFGLQDIVKNFFAGIIVLLERPIMVGDRIEIDKVNGDVVEIRTRSTVIRTNDDVFLIVPNSKFITDIVTNWSFRSNRIRFRVPVGVASDSHPREVESALVAAALRCDGVLPEPPPSVYFRGFGDSTLDFELLCWTSQMLHKRPAFVSELNFAIWEELSKAGIAIPNPQRDLHIRSAEGLSFLKDSRAPTARPAWNLHLFRAEGAPMNRDEIDGKKNNLAGRVKEAAGTLTGNKELESEGADQRAGGAVEEGLGKARRKVGEALEDLGNEVKR